MEVDHYARDVVALSSLSNPPPPVVSNPPFRWNENSCHFDVFVESIYSCLLALGICADCNCNFPTEPQELADFIEQNFGIGDYSDPLSCLFMIIKYRHCCTQHMQINKVLRNTFDRVFGGGTAMSPRTSNPIHWMTSLSSSPLFSITFKTTTRCEFQEVNSISNKSFLDITIDVNENVQESINCWIERRLLVNRNTCGCPEPHPSIRSTIIISSFNSSSFIFF